MILTIEDSVTSVAISPDTKLVAAGGLDNIVRIWDIEKGCLLGRLEGHTDAVYNIIFSPNSRQLVSGSLDNAIKMWELHTPRPVAHDQEPPLEAGHCIKTFKGHRVYLTHFPSPEAHLLILYLGFRRHRRDDARF